MVRNGNRWRVAAIDTKTNRVAAERLDDHARVAFDGDYLREHVSLGFAVTVHSAQGVTADASHAVLGENTSRPLLYVAMTRGRHTNIATSTNAPAVTTNTATKSPMARTSPTAGDGWLVVVGKDAADDGGGFTAITCARLRRSFSTHGAARPRALTPRPTRDLGTPSKGNLRRLV